MTKADSKTDDRFWLPVATLAKVFAVTPQGLRASILPLVPDDARRQGSHGLELFGRAVVEAWAKRELAKEARRLADDDPLLVGDASSAGLERYRLARARMVELDLQERLGTLVNRHAMREGLAHGSRLLRELGQRLQTMFGLEAGRIHNEIMTEVERNALEYLGNFCGEHGITADDPAGDFKGASHGQECRA